MNTITVIIVILALFLSACGAPGLVTAPQAALQPSPLTVFAAASLTDAFTEIGEEFEMDHPATEISFNFGGSQTLRTQIEQGAYADVFASANEKEMNILVSGSMVSSESVQIFSTNQLVMITPANNPADLENLTDLSKPGLKLILAAKEVPAGSYTLEMLDRYAAVSPGFKEKTLLNVVSYENDVRQVVAKVALGEADAGIVYISDTVASPNLVKVKIPDGFNVVARFPIAVLSESATPEFAQEFISYVFSAEGQAILDKWGFTPVR